MSFRLPITCAAVAAALLAVLLAAGPTEASCIYNNAALPLQAQSYIKGMHDWVVHPTEHRCTRGTGGKDVTLWMMDPFENHTISTFGKIWVADHGWISVYRKSDDRWKVVSHNADGSEHATIYLEPQPQ